MLSIQKAMESSEMGFARHKVIYDEEGKPVDYVYLAVNLAFERPTGLKKGDLLNRRVHQINNEEPAFHESYSHEAKSPDCPLPTG